MSRGRPKRAGARRRDGRLVPVVDYGNDFVRARRDTFKVFQGGKAGDQLGDPIGRAWACGLLDGATQDSSILRDIGRRYADLHARVFAQTGVRIGGIEPRSRGTGDGTLEDKAGERFGQLDHLARNAGAKERMAMRKLCVAENPDESPPWLTRLIMARLNKMPGEPRDCRVMSQAVRSLVAMVEG